MHALKTYNYYIDDSGTRQLDRKATVAAHGNDWFALGGVLVDEEDEADLREKIAAVKNNWDIQYPFHSSEIRARSGNFRWLTDSNKRAAFLTELQSLICNAQVVGLACVIDRPGYKARYEEKYGRQKWSLCKTAFCIAIERAARFADQRGGRLRVFVERSDKHSERALKTYYEALRQEGMPFNQTNSAKYGPLSAERLAALLFDFKVKQKTSPIMQLADLYLYPICRGGYESNYQPYRALVDSGRLIESHIPSETAEVCGSKYSCFEKTKA